LVIFGTFGTVFSTANYFWFGKTNVAILEVYFRFRFDHIAMLGKSFCIRLSNFIQIRPS